VTQVHRLTIRPLPPDPRATSIATSAPHLGIAGVRTVRTAAVVFVRGALDDTDRNRLTEVLVDPLLESGSWETPAVDATVRTVEVTLHAGVTDSDAAAVAHAAGLLGVEVEAIATGNRFEVEGDLTEDDLDHLVRRLLANPVIERWAVDAPVEPSFAAATDPPPVEHIDLPDDDVELDLVNKARAMYLDPAELRAVQAHFAAEGRPATDVELETLAQTWSEHCAHKTFRALIVADDGIERPPLLKRLRESTEAIDAPFVVSAYVGNAGIVRFAPGRTLALKCETHNHPSAVEPFGGANTGVGGVIRDILGAAHRPIACTDILCFGPADTDPESLPDGVLHPERVRDGVIAGVADYGNKIGLPTVAGSIMYDPAYTANPLVFCGCIGEAPDDLPPLTGPHPGDRVVVLGGRTGRDGIRGATFSSATMDATTGEVAGASVQIGDPITEKLLIDVLSPVPGSPLPFTSITDCGAGGLSSAVGEMAEGIGADVELSVLPVKYPGLAPWELWLSEAQERMVVSVAPEGIDALFARCAAHGVEATDMGVFTGDGRLVVRHEGAVVLDLDTGFLHDGRPQRSLPAVMPRPNRTERSDAGPARRAAVAADGTCLLLRLLSHPDIASKADTIHRYDHEILGRTVVRPLVGVGDDAPADGVVLAHPSDAHGIALGLGMNPWQGLQDAERMAWACVDEAMRNVVAVGADPSSVALLDNFSWGDPRRPTTFGELVAAVDGCCDASEAFAAPFVSGKDSLNNEYLGADGERHAVPPTLVVTAVAHVPDAGATVTPDLKAAGNALVLLGRTLPEFGGSHLDMLLGPLLEPRLDASPVPAPDLDAPERYRRLHESIRAGQVQSCHDCSEGGLAVALAEMAIGGGLGIRVDTAPHSDPATAWFSESIGRLVCEVTPGDLAEFLATFGDDALVLGEVTATGSGEPAGEPTVEFVGLGEVAVSILRASFLGDRTAGDRTGDAP
jgi:phosphoribosylformylglycinamidine synthase